jgi:acetyltransferase-like isoleucine patch superfamily enzyme
MEANSTIGTLTVCKGLKFLHLKQNSSIGRANWITGSPLGHQRHYRHQHDRRPELIVGEHSAITNRHLIDCTNSVTIGAFTTFAGFRSQILTHSIELENCRQSSAPVTIGDYSFIGTDCVLLGGSSLPDHSVLGAKSLLNKQYSEPFWLYAGNPARPVDRLSEDMGYFKRQVGFVD